MGQAGQMRLPGQHRLDNSYGRVRPFCPFCPTIRPKRSSSPSITQNHPKSILQLCHFLRYILSTPLQPQARRLRLLTTSPRGQSVASPFEGQNGANYALSQNRKQVEYAQNQKITKSIFPYCISKPEVIKCAPFTNPRNGN